LENEPGENGAEMVPELLSKENNAKNHERKRIESASGWLAHAGRDKSSSHEKWWGGEGRTLFTLIGWFGADYSGFGRGAPGRGRESVRRVRCRLVIIHIVHNFRFLTAWQRQSASRIARMGFFNRRSEGNEDGGGGKSKSGIFKAEAKAGTRRAADWEKLRIKIR